MNSLGRAGKLRGKGDGGRRLVGRLLLVLVCAVGLPGCTRNFFRTWADKQVDNLLKEKDQFGQWRIEQYHVYPDPRARFADPTNPNRPPMPPDDPAAFLLSPNPQKPYQAGIGRIEGDGYFELLRQWNEENRAEHNEQAVLDLPVLDLKVGRGEGEERRPPPAPRSEGWIIKLEQAAELGLINSREFQTSRENLYLAALPVTQERFAFAPQLFALETAIREKTGAETPEGAHNRWRLDGETGLSQRLASGALLLLRLANQTVIEMGNTSGPKTLSESTLTLDLMQPLLRAGGKAVTLEALTQAERNLLYQIRDYARFRKEFFVNIAGGTNFITNRLLLGADFVPPAAGYLPTLQRKALVAIERQNIAHVEAMLRYFENIQEGGDISQLQVEQVEQQLLQSRSTLLQREQEYKDSLDQFKRQLGLPTNLPLELDETPLAELVRQLQDFVRIFNQFRAARLDAAELENPRRATGIREDLRRLFTRSTVVQGTRFQTEFPSRWAVWEKRTTEQVEATLLPFRREYQQLKDLETDLEIQGKALGDEERLRLQELDREIQLGKFEQLLRNYEEQARQAGVYSSGAVQTAALVGLAGMPLGYGPWLAASRELVTAELAGRQGRLLAVLVRELLNQFDQVLGEARNERMDQLRRRWPVLPPSRIGDVDLLTADENQALDTVGLTALANRLDLMNIRAQVVDAWRQIAVTANALMGVLNVAYHMESLSPSGEAKPLAFAGRRTRNQLVINGELPLVRRAERNGYRAALINFQQERRNLMAAEDSILADVRSRLRQLRVLAENYRIQQRAVELAYSQLENSLETFRAPPAPTDRGGAATAAALTQQLLNALQGLPRAQNLLVATWINYQIIRLQLYRDLELMPLDYRGVWIDELVTNPARANGGPFDPDPSAFGSERRPGPVDADRLPTPRSLPDRPPSRP